MPLKSQDYIHRFFEDNDGKEFIGYYQGDITTEINRKVRRWHLFPESFKKTGSMTAVGKQVLRAGFIRLQQMTGFHRNKTIDFRKGTQWVSLTADCIGYLLQYKDEAERIYSHTFCADEIFVQTLCWNSSFREHIYDIFISDKFISIGTDTIGSTWAKSNNTIRGNLIAAITSDCLFSSSPFILQSHLESAPLPRYDG